MQGIKRKLVYVTLFEALATVLTSALVMLVGFDLLHAGGMALATSATAVVWNLVWNSGFEFWEARQVKRGRGFWRRVGHAVGFELGLTVLIVPLIAWWLQIRWWEALALDAGLTLMFLVYTFLFNLGFDRVFGLPLSAQPREPQPALG